jgi:putative hydroxymethylpyrimidine transport system ATP-binding protein
LSVNTAPGVSLSGRFDIGADTLFDGLELRIDATAWTCLLGPSGVGKSTILRLLAGLETGGAFTGEIVADDGHEVKGRMAYMGQTDLIAPWLNVLDAVTIGAKLRGEPVDLGRARALIDAVGLTPHTAKRRAELSGGMRQRVALARTLMEDRPIVLLDEPFSALDAKTRADMQELAFESLGGKTVLLVTHDPAEAARLGQAIYLMQSNGLSAMDPPASAPIRPVDAQETLRVQARLYRALRSADS